MTDAPVTADDEPDFEWMIVEIFGHRRHAGRVREEDRFGAKMLRIDIPTIERIEPPREEGRSAFYGATAWTTHFYGGAAIFSATLTDEASAPRMNAAYAAPARLALSHDEMEGFQ